MSNPEIQSDNSHLIEFIYTKGANNIYNSMQFHSCYELYFFLNGNVEYICNRFRRNLSPNQLIIIPPGEYHNLHVLGNEKSYERCVLNIHPVFFEKNFPTEILNEKYILEFSDSDRIAEHFRYLINCRKQVSKQDYDTILTAVATDIMYLIKYSKKSHLSNHSDYDSIPAQLIKYIDENFTDDISLDCIAKEFNYSVSHICHIFKESYGISIKQYTLQKRLNCVNAEILQGKKVQKVSQAYGFKNYPAFFRLYKKTFGTAPSKH